MFPLLQILAKGKVGVWLLSHFSIRQGNYMLRARPTRLCSLLVKHNVGGGNGCSQRHKPLATTSNQQPYACRSQEGYSNGEDSNQLLHGKESYTAPMVL